MEAGFNSILHSIVTKGQGFSRLNESINRASFNQIKSCKVKIKQMEHMHL